MGWGSPIHGEQACSAARTPTSLAPRTPARHGPKHPHAHMHTSHLPTYLPHTKYLHIYTKADTNPTRLYAAYWVAFGPHGPRALDPPGEGKKVALYTAIGLCASLLIFGTVRSFAKPPPSTMTKEWQEATNEFLKVSCRCSPWRPMVRMATNSTVCRTKNRTH